MSNKFICWTIFIILCIIWGSSFKLMHDSQLGLSAAQIAALRIFSAGLVFVPFAFFHFSKVPKGKKGLVILSAVFGNLLPAFLFAEAITHLDSSLAGILNSLTPICVVVIGIFFFKDKISSQKIGGVLTGFLGLVLLTALPMILEKKAISFDNFSYTLLIVLATFLYGINVNMVGHYLKGLNPVHIATVSLAFMVIPSGIILWQQNFFQLDFGDAVIKRSVLESIALGVAGSAIATVLFYILVQRAGILFASLVTYGIPFIALFWGLIDNEKITWVQPLCLGIILLGVWLANRPEKTIKQ
ncbi:MAG TPA: DMT family transporter [Chitinophagaceae bacterium]|nr:DMT family transporter [Chitinophagaceae bacterium]